MNVACVLHLLGRLCMVLAGLLLAPLLVCLHDGTLGGETATAFLQTAGGTFALGLLLRLIFRFKVERFALPEAFAIVTGAWVVFSVLGALPFLLTGQIPDVVDAVFETMSGATTTGASILSDPAALDRPLLLWRSLLQLVGGLGIVALSVAILPALGAGGNFLFQAEAVGPEKGKLAPRISSMSKLLWALYLFLTAASIGAFALAGMAPFDAINHGLTTMATGGFSTQADSFAGYSATIQWIAIVFMFLAGTSFVLLLALARGRWGALAGNTEWRVYVGMLLLATAACVLVRQGAEASDGWEPLVRSSMFTVVSIASTTGFGTADFAAWPAVLHLLLMAVMLCGACAGSTAGGSKVVRLVLWWKAAQRELRRLLRPTAVLVVKIEDRAIPEGVVAKALGFLVLFVGIWVTGAIVLMLTGLGTETAFAAVIASLSCVGPGFDAVGPTQNYGALTDLAKWVLVVCMLLGRLELFSVLVLVSRSAWRR